MPQVTHVVGVDPGLVHTGVVRFVFDHDDRSVTVQDTAIAGPDVAATKAWAGSAEKIFVEAYRPRSHFDTDQAMVQAVADMRRALGATVVSNTGVKQIVRRPLLELLGAWSFATVTHHQDLRSAARIAVFGMLKDEYFNLVVSQVVLDHVAGRSWHVRH